MAVRLGVPESVTGPLARRLAWVTAARLGILLVALGAVAFINLKRGFSIDSESIQIIVDLVAMALALATAYAVVLRSGRRLEWLAVTQLVLDQVTWTVLVYLTGGASSGATSFYGLTCLLGAFLIGLRGATIAGLAGVSCYAVVSFSLYTGALPPPRDQPVSAYAVTGEELASHLVVNVLVIVVVTLLTSYLAERLRTAGGRIMEAEARAESAERLAVLGRLSAGLAHEIRNPLGSIAGSIQLLRASPALGEEDQNLCEIIQREAARLNDLVTDMMDVARPRKPLLDIVDAARLAREVVVLASQMGRGVSDVAVTYHGEDAAIVQADASQLRQLVWNLVRNAVQSARARVRVQISERAARVVLGVDDDGDGIDDEAKERLFDVFFTTRAQGTGLGLAVVKRIADDHGFAIRVASEAGRGARFEVDLGPRSAVAEEPPPSVPEPSSLPAD